MFLYTGKVWWVSELSKHTDTKVATRGRYSTVTEICSRWEIRSGNSGSSQRIPQSSHLLSDWYGEETFIFVCEIIFSFLLQKSAISKNNFMHSHIHKHSFFHSDIEYKNYIVFINGQFFLFHGVIDLIWTTLLLLLPKMLSSFCCIFFFKMKVDSCKTWSSLSEPD